jgi:hypothetical protein
MYRITRLFLGLQELAWNIFYIIKILKSYPLNIKNAFRILKAFFIYFEN